MGAATCPQASSEHVLPRNLLTGGLYKISHLCATAYKLVNNWPCNWKCVPLPAHKPRLNMFCPEISLLGGLCKISHLCATTYKLVNNWPCNWKWVPLPAHKPRLNMFCPEISLLGGLCKISHLCATAYKLVNNWPCNWKWVPLPAHKPRLNMFCPEISLLGGLCKISHLCATAYVLLLTSLWTTDPAIGNGCHYLPTNLVWTCFAQESPYWGACVKSVTYVLLLMCYCLQANWPCNWKWVPLPAHKPRLNMFCPEISLLGGLCKISHLCATAYVLLLTSLWTTDPAIGNGCHYLPTSLVWACFAQKSAYWGACVKSVTYVLLLMCYCLQACEQLTLQLEMGATTCPQASSEHVLPRNLLTGGLV